MASSNKPVRKNGPSTALIAQIKAEQARVKALEEQRKKMEVRSEFKRIGTTVGRSQKSARGRGGGTP